MRKYPQLSVTWPEKFLQDHARTLREGYEVPDIPDWGRLEEESIAYATSIMVGRSQWPHPALLEAMPWLGDIKSPFDLNYVQHFMGLPSVFKSLVYHTQAYSKNLALLKQHGVDMLQSPRETMLVNLYGLYSMSRWKEYGKKVMVLDKDTFELLANTQLPKMPARYLKGPLPTFWLEFPKDVYRFRTPILPEGGHQDVAGVMVSFSHADPEDTTERQLTLVIGGTSESGDSANDGMVYFNEALDDRPLSEVFNRTEKELGLDSGGYELGTLSPRAVLNLCLYLMQEHPDLIQVAPPQRKHFKEIKSPIQRKKALETQANSLRHLSSLPYTYVGRPFDPNSELADPNRKRSWALDESVWVNGHWKFQPYGPRNSLRRLTHIAPYWKGPNKPAENIAVVRVTPAQEVKHD